MTVTVYEVLERAEEYGASADEIDAAMITYDQSLANGQTEAQATMAAYRSLPGIIRMQIDADGLNKSKQKKFHFNRYETSPGTSGKNQNHKFSIPTTVLLVIGLIISATLIAMFAPGVERFVISLLGESGEVIFVTRFLIPLTIALVTTGAILILGSKLFPEHTSGREAH
ncbi:hypothetical protein B7Z00_01555 [Candidatus Saccharibacteria bacterium 32-50-10]|nr:MAG: hypothetical protein B7Z00_01555 [Candidatus Saccharibacteria bacterium 32-50-10]